MKTATIHDLTRWNPADKKCVPHWVRRSPAKPLLVLAGLLVLLDGRPAMAFPRQSGYVNDFASVLTADDRAYLEEFLRNVERDTTAEVVVATVTSLDGLTIEEYTNRLFAEWGIGKRVHDNGVLLLVAPAERQVRIEVGYGLEGSLPDGLAGEIIRTAIVPEFKQNNLRRGIGRGLDRLARVVRSDASAAGITRAPQPTASAPPLLVVVPFFAIFVTLAGFMAGLALRTRTLVLLVLSGLLTAIPLAIAATISATALAVLMPLEMLALAFGYRKGGTGYWMRTLRTDSPSGTPVAQPGTWILGGTWDGSSGGTSDSSGSDTSSSSDSGGGSSGGGGASGHW